MAVCERIELGKWKQRGLWAKTQEFFASFLEEQA